MSAAISTHDATKSYGELVAVNKLNLEVEAGEVFGFLGPNGAGKSTTIRCLLDLARWSTGTSEVLGLDSRRDSVAAHRRLGYLPGDLALYGNLTGHQLLKYFSNLRGGVDFRFVDALADRFDADLSRRCSEYSSGNRQKLGLIQAFMHKPELVILDEPDTGLDPLVQQSFHELLRETRADGRTVFLSSHTLSEVERVADRVGIIRHGLLVEVASIESLKAMAIRKIDFEFPERVDPALFQSIPGVRNVTAEGLHLTVAYEGSLEAILKEATRFEPTNLSSREADLEEIFLAYYRDGDAGPTAQTRSHAAR
ncbi:MAG: ABC transporter ATP-binding protein [Tepidiformaceae bacterium]